MELSTLEWITWEKWDDTLWKRVAPIYREAFPSGAKSETIIRGMLEKSLAELHACFKEGGEAVAMALTGLAEGANALIIDYFTVRRELRGQGIGGEFLNRLCSWARKGLELDGIIIEVEAEPSERNLQRLEFWLQCGFRATEYEHQYIWVPEPYRACVLHFGEPSPRLSLDGEVLFRHIVRFHRRAYGRK